MGLVKEAPYYTIDFEGSKWSALIDTPEYGGPLLYGADGGGFYKTKVSMSGQTKLQLCTLS